ncbi:hypothetical protein FJZ23_02695, partial [Candidatus Parcubacteria bacterium]|nr:hypothetical protein [Candidatus Parcubacteria bacterium]
RDIRREIAALQSQADALAARNIALSELQTAVQTQSFIEREARLKLGLKKPGEEVVVVQEGESGEGIGSDQQDDPLGLVLDAQSAKEPVANATKWWYYFFNKNAYRAL